MNFILDTSCFSDVFFDEIKETEKKIFYTDELKRGNNLSVCGRVLLGYILNKKYNIDSFSYIYGENGKPYFENADVLFNISHSGSHILCCVSDCEIGCDIESVKEYNPKIAQRFFTEKERSILDKADNKKQIFTRLWTLKESILKKVGTGITGGLDTYCFADFVFENRFTAYGCNFICGSAGDCEYSVCSEKKYDDTDIKFVSADDLKRYIDDLN